MRNIFRGLVSLSTRAINVLTGGDADWNFSARVHRDGLGCEPFIDAIFFWEGPGHCAREYQGKISRVTADLAAHDARR